ncbi:MAG: hypothetical protein WCE94_04510 [Candidatus Methanoperedens sp.]
MTDEKEVWHAFCYENGKLQDLEKKINDVIYRNKTINFIDYTIGDSKMMQRIAENKCSFYQLWFTFGLFLLAIGFSVLFRDFSVLNMSTFFGLIIIFIASAMIIKWGPKFERCQGIIIYAAYRIYFEDWKKENNIKL